MHIGRQQEPVAENIRVLKQQHHGIGRVIQHFIEPGEELGNCRLAKSALA